MSDAEFRGDATENTEASIPPIPLGVEAENPLAWELIDAGRYMPRRIRGSFRGRVLG
jgi:hypothetical protein